MKTSRILFVLFISLLTISFSTAFYPAPDPDNKKEQLLEKSNLFNLRFPQEKIYLHLDRPSYWANDDIWFKAYLKNSPISESNLYVELLSSKGLVVYKKLCWAQNGLAYGDIHLADTISSGVYQIRAYTDWMRNFDDAWFFRRNLVIWNLRDKKVKTDSIALRPRDIDLKFFPEGGTFVSGLKNRVAFKATDKNGKGINVDGVIFDDKDNKITNIKSSFNGLGSFVFEPQENRKYAARVTVAGNIAKDVDLPVPQKEGVILAFEPSDTTKIRMTISTKSRASDIGQRTEFLIVGQSGGEICFRKEVAVTGDRFNLEMDRTSLPAGIVKFTLFDQEMIPRCERLVFIKHHDNINIEIKPDKSAYITREKIQLDVKAVTHTGIPCKANLSISVYNPESQLETEKYPNNILTQFLLNSELRGNIEEPAFYFKDDSLTTSLALDNLMLTHGYRQFEWKEISENKFPEISYQPVGCIQLGGTVTSTLRGKPVSKAKVTMMTVKSLLGTYEQTTDSLGRFLFTDLYFRDTVYVSLQAINQKGKRNTVIDIDERWNTSPKADYLPFPYKFKTENIAMTSTYLSELGPEIINRKWRLSDTILLGDINVMTKKKVADDGLVRMYAKPDFVVKISKDADIYPNVIEMMDSYAYLRRYTDAEFFLDGAPVTHEFIASLPVNGFDKVEVLKFSPLVKGGAPGVFFYLKRGAPQYVPDDVFGMKSYTIIGYSITRKFFSPQYETPNVSVEKKDFRNTLYWNPIIRTDSTGVAQVTFYNSDEAGNMQVVVEGMTSDGKLCRGVCKYNVAK